MERAAKTVAATAMGNSARLLMSNAGTVAAGQFGDRETSSHLL